MDRCPNHKQDNLDSSNSSSSNSSYSNFRSSNSLSNSNNICHNSHPLTYQYLLIFKTLRYYYKATIVEYKPLPIWTVIIMVIPFLWLKLQHTVKVWWVTTISSPSPRWSNSGLLQDRVPHIPPRILTCYLVAAVLQVLTTKVAVLQMGKPLLS